MMSTRLNFRALIRSNPIHSKAVRPECILAQGCTSMQRDAEVEGNIDEFAEQESEVEGFGEAENNVTESEIADSDREAMPELEREAEYHKDSSGRRDAHDDGE